MIAIEKEKSPPPTYTQTDSLTHTHIQYTQYDVKLLLHTSMANTEE